MVLFFGLLVAMYIGWGRYEKYECLKAEEDSKTYSGWSAPIYLVDQCRTFGIELPRNKIQRM